MIYEELHIYGVAPIDEGQFAFKTFEEAVRELSEDGPAGLSQDRDDARATIGELSRKLLIAKQAARELSGWNGDTDEVYVFGIPTAVGIGECGFLWRQTGTGETFIASPVRLPHIEVAKYSYFVVSTGPKPETRYSHPNRSSAALRVA